MSRLTHGPVTRVKWTFPSSPELIYGVEASAFCLNLSLNNDRLNNNSQIQHTYVRRNTSRAVVTDIMNICARCCVHILPFVPPSLINVPAWKSSQPALSL